MSQNTQQVKKDKTADYMTLDEDDGIEDAEILDDEDDPEIVKMNKTRYELKKL